MKVRFDQALRLNPVRANPYPSASATRPAYLSFFIARSASSATSTLADLLPAGGDNAAMAEPPKADPPTRKRRWF